MRQLRIFLLYVCIVLVGSSQAVSAAFITAPPPITTSANPIDSALQAGIRSTREITSEDKRQSGFWAYSALICAALGLILLAGNALLFASLLGMAGGVAAREGLKHYKHIRKLKVLCKLSLVACGLITLLSAFPIVWYALTH